MISPKPWQALLDLSSQSLISIALVAVPMMLLVTASMSAVSSARSDRYINNTKDAVGTARGIKTARAPLQIQAVMRSVQFGRARAWRMA